MRQTKEMMKKITSSSLIDELKCRKRVLRRLDYCTPEDVILINPFTTKRHICVPLKFSTIDQRLIYEPQAYPFFFYSEMFHTLCI
ncbi:Exosome RNA helicase MTR4 [Dermatophagoides farinae]|uniref:Exosome RNA helicase MTR4 n=1 Tax=Dermatophagoides farinae TaxID=6954 RepID=A0A922HYI4_DERFA|nr:Exosome RNA helicase MTR4 [Dermatophagoides farinae]